MVKLEVNGFVIEVETVAEAVEFCRSWNTGIPESPAPTAESPTFFRSRNRADKGKQRPPYQVSETEVLALLDAVTYLPANDRTATQLTGRRQPVAASRHMRGVAQRLVELGFEPSSVLVERRRFGPRTLDPGPKFREAFCTIQERLVRGEAF